MPLFQSPWESHPNLQAYVHMDIPMKANSHDKLEKWMVQVPSKATSPDFLEQLLPEESRA